MISDFFITLAANVSAWLLSFLPGGNLVDQGIVTSGQGLANIFALMGSLGTWVNWMVLGTCVSSVMGLYFVSLLVRVFRAVIGHLPMIGGNG